MTVLALLSGGLDSTWALWKQLSETHYPVTVLHVTLMDDRKRYIPERIASRQIVQWLEENVRPLKQYKEVVVDCSDLSSPLLDSAYVAPVAASMMLDDKTASTILMGSALDEEEHFIEQSINDGDRLFDELFKVLWRQGCGTCPSNVELRKIKIIHYAVDTYKAEMMRVMPQPLVDLTWSCRTPVWNREGPQICGVCFVCKYRGGK